MEFLIVWLTTSSQPSHQLWSIYDHQLNGCRMNWVADSIWRCHLVIDIGCLIFSSSSIDYYVLCPLKKGSKNGLFQGLRCSLFVLSRCFSMFSFFFCRAAWWQDVIMGNGRSRENRKLWQRSSWFGRFPVWIICHSSDSLPDLVWCWPSFAPRRDHSDTSHSPPQLSVCTYHACLTGGQLSLCREQVEPQ